MMVDRLASCPLIWCGQNGDEACGRGVGRSRASRGLEGLLCCGGRGGELRAAALSDAW